MIPFLPDLQLSHSMTVLLALGVIAVIIIVACVTASIIYKVRFVQMENENRKSVVDGGDRTDMSDYFHEKYKNDGSTGLSKDDLL